MFARFVFTSLLMTAPGCRAEPTPEWSCTSDACLAPFAPAVPASAPTVEPPPCPPPGPGALVLNEVLADPSGADVNGDGASDPYDDEFIEVLNVGPDAVDVTGVTLRVGTAARFTFGPGCLGPREAAVVFGGGQPHLTPARWTLAAGSPLRLPNQGSTVTLLGIGGETYDELRYGKEADGPRSLTRSPDGNGPWVPHPSLAAGALVASSAGLCVNGGAFPGCEGPVASDTSDDALIDPPGCPPAGVGELVINEVLADPGGLDANGDGLLVWQHDEFVEVLLQANGDRDLTGVALHVNATSRGELPAGCHSSPFGVVIFGGAVPPPLATPEGVVAVAVPKTLQLPNAGGVVELRRGGDVLDGLVYGSEGGDDQSLTRYPDGVGAFVPHALTPAASPMSPGRCVSGASLSTGCPAPTPTEGRATP